MHYFRRPKEALHRRRSYVADRGFQDHYSEGLADGLGVSWPPSGVSRRWHRHANATFVALVIVFVCVCVTDFVLTVRARLSPPVSLSRDPAATQLKMPYFTVCRPLLLIGNDVAGWGDWQGIPYATSVGCLRTVLYGADGVESDDGTVRHRVNCTATHWPITTSKGDGCEVIGIDQAIASGQSYWPITTFKGDGCEAIGIHQDIDVNKDLRYAVEFITPRAGMDMHIDVNKDLRYAVEFITQPQDTFNWANYYVTDEAPPDGIDWNTSELRYDFGGVKVGNHYAAKLRYDFGGVKVGNHYAAKRKYDFGGVKVGNHYAAQPPPPQITEKRDVHSERATITKERDVHLACTRGGLDSAEFTRSHEGITKERDVHLACTRGGLSCTRTTTYSYGAEMTMLSSDEGNTTLVFDFTSDALGLMILAEQDPVDWLNLVSNAYSYLGYCLAAFTLLFGFARTARLRELEEAKTLHILKQHLAAVERQQRMLTECHAPVDTVVDDARHSAVQLV
ncbi:hypothetical protein JKP88DRAFT_350107 [Tribonema minus]|uniref:Uncharacterized protein n=1 Tax=Tribonema minus TaxID=303371 RepID=A0A835YXJ4_9STRA|nr:hypothetical protein JKP88DRAFT_350107 [Tribonema minus]